jgi:hypothetical protein
VIVVYAKEQDSKIFKTFRMSPVDNFIIALSVPGVSYKFSFAEISFSFVIID